ncbi:DUF1919 domain-containing protein [Kineothrix sp. MB12-C1]|uniref:DUF1919 domain-containing protein n=1 Tax=Kineothrix sp. MB12-C1 TaxID=3070215 RepID=UPI0027D31EB7|nr:DUF1919 domain-containing protein [Kineothrix sp. MB12-C1]WMC93861.1 DUF1919 domain-containing protein [Kineothrix sp. MB12-C1]
MKYRVIIWGIGEIYNKHVNTLKYLTYKEEIEIVAIIDKDYFFLSHIDGYPVVDIANLSNILFDYLIIMRDNEEEFLYEMLQLGITREKILPYRILDVPDLSFDEYVRVKESRISIISNNCWGGLVYRTLGLECCSPFKNLYLKDRAYLMLLSNMKEYLQYPLEFSKFEEQTDLGVQYPVMRLRDIKIHCNHDTEVEKVQENWNRRCSKINYNNLFVAMFTQNKEMIERFLNIKVSPKIGFVPFEDSRNELINIHKTGDAKAFYIAVNNNAGIGNGSYSYNVLKLLSGDEHFYRCEENK